MNWKEIENDCPKAWELFDSELSDMSYFLKINKYNKLMWMNAERNEVFNLRDLYDFFDEQKIRVFPRYAESNGTWNYDIRIPIEGKWRMERIGNICSVNSRIEAETEAFTKAFEILENKNF